jgi:phosphatidylserine/phosphatidylglycerophosphate/cardiolipin synthase-like enzyme
VWRSHRHRFGFTSEENQLLGRQLQQRGAEALLDMRIRMGGSHHQKMVVIRHRDDPARDVAYVGGIDLCHSRRDDAEHRGDPQAIDNLAREYGATPPWHDAMVAISGPAVHDAETVFRERWEDPTRPTRNPLLFVKDRVLGMDMDPDPLAPQWPPPPPVDGGTHAVQLLRTYPNLRHRRDYPFAPGGERSVARGYTKAVTRARRLIYVEDQYLWGHHVGDVFARALRDHPDLHVIAVLPLYPDLEGPIGRTPHLLGRYRAMSRMVEVAPDRVALYGIENAAGTPVYVHAKICIIDDTWASTGSDNFNRRSWTHDSELSAAVVDNTGEYARRLRLTLAAEHLDRDHEDLGDCVDPQGMYAAFEASARRLDDWYAGGRVGPRPRGRLRRLAAPDPGPVRRALALPAYRVLHDPDGRPRLLRRREEF